MVWVPTKVKGKLAESDPVPRNIPIFLPEDILKYLFQEVGLEFCMEDIRQFWNHAQTFKLPWASASNDGTHYPLALYGDSAKFSNAGDKITGIFISMPLFNPRSSRFSRFLVAALETYQCLGGLTLNPLYQKIVDSMWKLYSEGLIIKGRTVKFVTVELRGDWEWHCFALGLTPTWRHDSFCWRCLANKKEDPNFLDFTDNPEWISTERSHAQFLADCIDHRAVGRPCTMAI